MPVKNRRTITVDGNGDFFKEIFATSQSLDCSYNDAVTSCWNALTDRIKNLEEQLENAKELVEAQEVEEASPNLSYFELKKSYDDLNTCWSNSIRKTKEAERALEEAQVRCAAAEKERVELKESYDAINVRWSHSVRKTKEAKRALEETQIRCAVAEQERVELRRKLSEAEAKLESQKLLETKLVAIQAIIDLITR